MSDFPDYIYAFEAERLEAGPVRVTADDVPGYDGKYIEYIRADLVPQWQPIDELATTDRVILLYDSGHIESGWPGERDGKKYIMTGHGKIGLSRFTHFFIAPEMPK